MAQLVFSAALLAVPAAGRTQAQPATPAPAAHAEHAHAAAPAAEVPAGKRWATDAPLRDGIRRVRQAVQALEHGDHARPDAARAADIDGAVNYMIANCKLAPDADAALHGLIAKFLVGANAVRSGKDVPAALTDMQAALTQYPLLFDDPTWNTAAD